MSQSNLNIKQVTCEPFQDQKAGTAGLRKKVTVFQKPHYIESFIQAIFDTLRFDKGEKLVIGGDGRFFNDIAIQKIVSCAVANKISHIYIGKDGLLSTPAASNLIRCTRSKAGIILTASHNPGGANGDFGIKLNIAPGAQANEKLINQIYERSKKITSYRIAEIPNIQLDKIGIKNFGDVRLEIIDPIDEYIELMDQFFDFELIQSHLKKKVKFHFDAFHAVTGPYAKKIFCDLLGVPQECIVNAISKEDFGGMHPDPNPNNAKYIYNLAMSKSSPDLLAASDGDGDRNMILGPGMMVSPGDSLAIMLANSVIIPGYRKGIDGVARSMPTSRAVDSVASSLGIPCYETPTGWRFFCNLLEKGHIGLCGEESFGTSSLHALEKDGLWAILFWLNMLAGLEQSLPEIVHQHWRRFGRCYYQRHDYQISDMNQASDLIKYLRQSINSLPGKSHFGSKIIDANEFNYTDPVDGSISENQGIRVFYENGGRIVFRLSGTGTSGATLRMYLDKPESEITRQHLNPNDVLSELANAGAELSRINHFTGLKNPVSII
ncbi:MAG: alpha-D-glucose phosphate-specific phosphoglucomutase [Pseudomonadota bacterium]|nr:alpha-D-glucose phosphate-specific phosphoglucomutase [Pseudomonadota bacterium]